MPQIFSIEETLASKSLAVVSLQVRINAFRGSTGVPRQCFGAPDYLEQRHNGLEKYGPVVS